MRTGSAVPVARNVEGLHGPVVSRVEGDCMPLPAGVSRSLASFADG